VDPSTRTERRVTCGAWASVRGEESIASHCSGSDLMLRMPVVG
jgi:hypothetical protein